MIIYKYPLPNLRNVVELSVNASPLHVNYQNGELYLWAATDPRMPLAARHFVVYGTGHELPAWKSIKYIGTAHNQLDKTVWHVFEDMYP